MNRGIAILAFIAALGCLLSLRIATTSYGSMQQAAGWGTLILAAAAAGLLAGAIVAGKSNGTFLPFRLTRVWLGSLRKWADRKERELERKD